ncbi:MAG TPA: hypothetical protein VK116_08980 [Planctomycetota bacterium]|nr:hypothetical protein [Planctomycetota bacterium]
MRLGRCSWILLAAFAFAGCQSTRPGDSIPDPSFEDDFGYAETEPITEERLAREEQIFERAQLELRFGGRIPFDFLRPSEDTLIDPGFGIGSKLSFEIPRAKNVYLGLLVEWGYHEVDSFGEVAGPEQIDLVDSFQKWNFMLSLDYDIPLTDSDLPLLFRVGGAVGVNLQKFNEDDQFNDTIDTFVGFVLRPSIGLRLPINENLLVFTEASYEWVPERDLVTNIAGAEVAGDAPIFSAGGLWLGLAFQWH